MTVHPPIPGFCFPAETLKIWNSSLPQTLPGEDPDFDLRLIEPTAVCRCVVHGEPIPDFGGHFGSKHLRQRLLPMNVEIVQYQVDGLGCRVCQRQGDGHLGEFEARSVRRGKREMSTRF